MLVVLGTIGIVGAIIAIGIGIDRWIGALKKPEEIEADKERERKVLLSHGGGEAPATALRVRDAQIANLRITQRCAACHAVMTGGFDDAVRYGDLALLVLHFTCGSCAATRTVYIERIAG